jgi:hypothetical protein
MALANKHARLMWWLLKNDGVSYKHFVLALAA